MPVFKVVFKRKGEKHTLAGDAYIFDVPSVREARRRTREQIEARGYSLWGARIVAVYREREDGTWENADFPSG